MLLVPHDPAWAGEFAALREVCLRALGEVVLRVEHVGSTAVPDLQAKPILDIDLVIASYADFPRAVEALGRLGYAHQGDGGIAQREAFGGADVQVPYTTPRRDWMKHNLYVCPQDSRELARHVAFRDALRGREDWRREYEALKFDYAARAGDDRRTYARLKEQECRPFVERVLAAAGRSSVLR